jgi:hypothetical protein
MVMSGLAMGVACGHSGGGDPNRITMTNAREDSIVQARVLACAKAIAW